MSIIRQVRTRDFTITPNELHEASNLSWAAKGLHGYLLSRPDGWEPKLEHLATVGPDGKHATGTARKMLVDAGWIVENRVRDRYGQLRTHTYVFDSPGNTLASVPKQARLWEDVPPEPENRVPVVTSGNASDQPEPDYPDPDEPDPGEPDSGEPRSLVRTDTARTEKQELQNHPRAGARARDGQGALALQGQEQPKPKRRGKRPLPADWTPNAQHQAIAVERGIDLAEQADQFRDYCAANGRHYADHDAAFRKWLRSGYQQPMSNAPAVSGNGGGRVFLTAQEQRAQRDAVARDATIAELAAAGVFRDR